jgi:hypothetical protein
MPSGYRDTAVVYTRHVYFIVFLIRPSAIFHEVHVAGTANFLGKSRIEAAMTGDEEEQSAPQLPATPRVENNNWITVR